MLQFGIQQGRVVSPGLFNNSLFLLHLCSDLIDVVEIIGKSDMDIGEGQGRKLCNDFVRAHALMFVPTDYVQDADAMACDSRLSPAGAGGFDDSL
jgi:hypothetical protein